MSMDGTERVWEGGAPGGPRRALMGFVALSLVVAVGMSVAASRGSGAPRTQVTPSPTPRPAPTALAFFNYPTAEGMRITALTSEGTLDVCRDGPELRVLDVLDDAMLLVDRRRVYRAPADCAALGEEAALDRVADLSSGKPGERLRGVDIVCGSFSPNGSRIALHLGSETLVADTDAASWSAVDDGGCRWVDEDHLLSSPRADMNLLDELAIDVRSGRRRLLDDPLPWTGAIAVDGSRSLFHARGRFRIFDATTRRTQIVPSLTGDDWDLPIGSWFTYGLGSRWDARSERFFVNRGDAIAVHGVDGYQYGRYATASDWGLTAGWLPDGRLLMQIDDRFVIGRFDGTWQGVTHAVELRLPAYVNDEDDPNDYPSAFIPSQREGLLAEAVVADHVEPTSIQLGDVRLRVSLPPSWRTKDCARCRIGPYRASVTALDSWRAPRWRFAVTSASEREAVRAIMSPYRNPGSCEYGCTTARQERARLAGVPATRVIIESELITTVIIARVGGSTVMIEGIDDPRRDPASALLLRTLKIER